MPNLEKLWLNFSMHNSRAEVLSIDIMPAFFFVLLETPDS
jgi:hypothetical protein